MGQGDVPGPVLPRVRAEVKAAAGKEPAVGQADEVFVVPVRGRNGHQVGRRPGPHPPAGVTLLADPEEELLVFQECPVVPRAGGPDDLLEPAEREGPEANRGALFFGPVQVDVGEAVGLLEAREFGGDLLHVTAGRIFEKRDLAADARHRVVQECCVGNGGYWL